MTGFASVWSPEGKQFMKEHGCTMQTYVEREERKAFQDAMETRSEIGRAWQEDQQDVHGSPEHPIYQYHQAEEQAKVAASNGQYGKAYDLLTKANQIQEQYEHDEFGGQADGPHAASKQFRLARRNSIKGMQRICDESVAACQARVYVQNWRAQYATQQSQTATV